MKEIFNKIRSIMGKSEDIEQMQEEGYVEIDTTQERNEVSKKIIIRPFAINEFNDIKVILGSLREGRTILLVNIRNIKENNLVELKRAINKLKKTTDAINGQIMGLGEDYIIITPSFAQIYNPRMEQKNIQTDAVGTEVYDEE